MDTPPASSEAARARMTAQPSRDTSAELPIRRELHARGFRYRVDARPVPGVRRRADLVFTRPRVAVFVDGCFWHACPEHCKWPKTNAKWWRDKLEGNAARDRDTDERLRDAGWRIVRVWEHEDPQDAADRIAEVVRDAPRKGPVVR